MVSIKNLTLTLLAASSLVEAHKVTRSVPLIDRSVAYDNGKRSLEHCHHKLNSPQNFAKRAVKREKFIRRHLEQKFDAINNIAARQEIDSAVSRVQKRTEIDDSVWGTNYCILTPETVIGPYYVKGEYIRENITEQQPGIDFLLDIQIVDIDTCEPIPDLYIDIWHCNSTGVYSGVASEGTADETFLRGIWKTDDDGVMRMQSIFPGWYEGRTTHVHVVTHVNETFNSNGTISGGTVNHIGQLFFNDDFIDEVADVYPYSTNTVERLSVDEDQWYPYQNSSGYDAIVNMQYLGNNITDGVVGYISIGLNLTANHDDDVEAVATLGA